MPLRAVQDTFLACSPLPLPLSLVCLFILLIQVSVLSSGFSLHPRGATNALGYFEPPPGCLQWVFKARSVDAPQSPVVLSAKPLSFTVCFLTDTLFPKEEEEEGRPEDEREPCVATLAIIIVIRVIVIVGI